MSGLPVNRGEKSNRKRSLRTVNQPLPCCNKHVKSIKIFGYSSFAGLSVFENDTVYSVQIDIASYFYR